MIMSNSKDDWGNSYFPNTNDVSVAGTDKYSMISFKTFFFCNILEVTGSISYLKMKRDP